MVTFKIPGTEEKVEEILSITKIITNLTKRTKRLTKCICMCIDCIPVFYLNNLD